VGKPKENALLARLRHRWDNIKMNIKDIGKNGVEFIDLVQDSGKWRALMDTVMDLGFHKIGGILTS
jgi:hypothetical protein